VHAAIDFPPFEPHPALRHPLAMTVAGALPRREPPALARSRSERVFSTVGKNRVLARCHFQRERERPCLLLVHGLVGDLSSPYVVGTAEKGFARGFHVVRANARNCGGTEALAEDSYHGGTTEDVLAVAQALAREGVPRVYMVGFSLGGSMALKLAGELGAEAPAWLAGVAALSPCLDFAAAAERMNADAFGRLCQRRFLRALRGIVQRRSRLYGAVDAQADLARARTIREFDARYTAPLGGFDGVEDYYARASGIAFAHGVRVPTLLVAARDDPLVPFATLERPEIAGNPFLSVLATERGGHVAFVGARPSRTASGTDPDRRWGENRLVQFCAELERRARFGAAPW
jgi:predicted alpha/beta-fold hydrolase